MRATSCAFKAASLGQWINMAATKPWWQTTPTARVGFVLGIVWTALGLGQLLVAIGTLHHRGLGLGAAGLGGAVVGLCLGGTYLVTAALLRRRERTGTTGQPGQ